MEQELSVKINADIKDLKQGMSNAEKEVKTLTDSLNRNKQTIRGLNTSYNRAAKELKDLKSSYERGETSVKDYTQASDRLENQLLDTSRKVKDYQTEIKRAENALEDAKSANISYANSTENVASSTQRTGRAVNNFGNAARGNAVPAMQSFSQVIQDAPYGIQGVANNIQQLTAQFGYLSAQSGGTKAALKGMLASLTGPAGILLAISAVTTLLVAFGDELFNSKTDAEKAADAYKKAKEELDRFISSLSELDKLDLTTEVNVKIETQRVRNLFEQALGLEGGGEDAQIAAIDALKEKYPVLLKDLNKANISYSDLTKTLKKVNTEFRELNRSQEAQKQWETNIKTIEQLEKQVGSIRTELEKSLPKSFWENAAPEEGWERFWDDATLGVNRLIRGFSELSKESGLAENLQKASAEIYRLKQANVKLDEEIGIIVDPTALQEKVQDELDKKPINIVPQFTSVDDILGVEEQIKNVEKLKKTYEGVITQFDEGSVQFTVLDTAIKKTEELIRKLKTGQELTSKFGQEAAAGGTVNPFDAVLDPETQLQASAQATLDSGQLERYMAAQDDLAANTKEMSEEMKAYYLNMANAISGSFGQMLNSIGQMAIEGELTFRTFTEAIGKMLVQIVSQAAAALLSKKLTAMILNPINKGIAQSNGIVAATSLAASMGPTGYLALPGLLGGANAMIQAAFGAAKFADGGIVGGNSYHGDKILARLNSGELILNQAQQKSLLNMTSNPAVIGGGEVFISRTVIRGNDLVTIFERANERNNRIS